MFGRALDGSYVRMQKHGGWRSYRLRLEIGMGRREHTLYSYGEGSQELEHIVSI